MLFHSGTTVSLIKVKNLKGDTTIYKEKITLVGITGHKVYTIGKMHATIDLNGQKIKHDIYVVKDDFPLDYEGVIGIDFLKKQQISCDYRNKEIKIGNAILKLKPHNKIVLKPRSETIVQAATNRNETGVIRAQQTAPGVYIGRCLVEPKNFLCPISVINTTDETMEIRTPYVTVEDMDREITHGIYTVMSDTKMKNLKSRREQI